MNGVITQLRNRWFALKGTGPVIPTEGLVFWASLNGDTPNKAETGQTLSAVGNVTYEETYGVPNARFANGVFCRTNAALGCRRPFSVSVWALTGSTGNRAFVGFSLGSVQSSINVNSSGNLTSYSASGGSSLAFSSGKWINLVVIDDGSHVTEFYGGELKRTRNSNSSEIGIDSLVIGNNIAEGYATRVVRMANLRIYDRVLTQNEIIALAHEFHPTA